ncbi:hypothetical protein AAF712_016639 [Marasmius tenuissimus]|uniref:Uncharacterized protein n=1 Tax=Marasmius tenuissimus TaxID=585030 RepID=A0ABR2Z663_9AGAR
MASGFHTPSFISRRQFLPSHSRIMSATYLLEERDGSSLITNDTSTPSALLDRSFFDGLHDRFGQHSEELRSERYEALPAIDLAPHHPLLFKAFPGRATYPSLHRPPHLVRTKKRPAKETLTKEQILLYSAPRVSETEGGVTTVKAYARSSGSDELGAHTYVDANFDASWCLEIQILTSGYMSWYFGRPSSLTLPLPTVSVSPAFSSSELQYYLSVSLSGMYLPISEIKFGV